MSGRLVAAFVLAGTCVAAGGQAPVTQLASQRRGAIAGRILDERGDPVIGMTVTAEQLVEDTNGQSTTRIAATTELDDLGEYRLGGLPEGRFVVSVTVAQLVLGINGLPLDSSAGTLLTNINGERVRPERGAQTRTYYPGVSSLTDSRPIVLAAGEERASIDFSVLAMSPRTWASVIGARPPDSPRAGGVIRGRVTRADGRPLPSVVVRILSDNYPGTPPSTVTDSDGRYEFSGLPAAIIRIVAERSGFLSAEYGQQRAFDRGESIAVRPDESRDRIDITLPTPGAIAGRVFDDHGDPVDRAFVRVLHARYEAGRSRLVDAGGLGSHRTDDRGQYRIYGLHPGTYVVSAAVGQLLPDQSIADRPGYAPTYFPGTPNPADARWVAVDLSAQVTGIDFILSPVATARVTGTRLDSAGNPAGGSIVLSPSRRSGSIAPMPVAARTYPDGRFEFPNVPPGEYVLQASTPGANAFTEGEFASMFVTVNGIDVTGLVIRTSRGSTIKGRVTVEGSRDEWLWSEITLSALPVDLDRSPLAGNSLAGLVGGSVRADWTFEMTGISGPRLLRVAIPPPAYRLKAVLVNGIDVTDLPLPFGTEDQSISDVEIVLTDRVPELSGSVTDDRGRGVANCAVIVFATERELWGPASRFVMMTRTERDGRFSVRRMPPGEYFVAAVDRLIEGEWQDPDLLEFLVRSSTRVTLAERQRLTTTVRLVVR